MAIRHANGRTDFAWLRVTARAWTTLSDSQAPAAWVTAGDAEEGLSTLRSWGRIREAAAFAEEQGLAVPPAVAAAVRLLDATDAVDPASMTPAEQRSAFAEVESKLAPAPPARGRRT